MKGWLHLELPIDPPCPPMMHVVPSEDDETTVANGHELHALCWCGPRRITGPLEDIVLSHNEPSWPGAHPDEQVLQQ